jgi:hypothetical protein
MDIFDRLDTIQRKIESTPPVTKKSFTSSLVNPLENVSDNLFSPGSTISSSTKKDIELLKTDIIPVESKELVWAPSYRFHNTLFPARLCSYDEAIAEDSIPLVDNNDDNVVVEIFNQEMYHNVTRLLLVPKAKVIPYYASTSKNLEKQDITKKWNEGNLKKMKKVSLNASVSFFSIIFLK